MITELLSARNCIIKDFKVKSQVVDNKPTLYNVLNVAIFAGQSKYYINIFVHSSEGHFCTSDTTRIVISNLAKINVN